MRKVLFVISLFGVSFANAQTSGTTTITTASTTIGSTSTVSTAPNNLNNPATSSSIGGWFNVSVSTSTGTQHLEVNYLLMSRPFITEVKLLLGTANPMTLSGKIVDASGTTMTSWSPVNIGYRYNHTFDISSFSVGNYHIDIYDEWSNKVCTIPFVKSSN